MEWYRRGHNEHDWKSCDGQKPSEGSNPSHSAKRKPTNFDKKFVGFLFMGCNRVLMMAYGIGFYLPNHTSGQEWGSVTVHVR